MNQRLLTLAAGLTALLGKRLLHLLSIHRGAAFQAVRRPAFQAGLSIHQQAGSPPAAQARMPAPRNDKVELPAASFASGPSTRTNRAISPDATPPRPAR